MIISYRDKETERLSSGIRVRAFEGIERALPGNRFESLQGDRAGRFSIRINDQWRICFYWNDEAQGFEEVEIVDYH